MFRDLKGVEFWLEKMCCRTTVYNFTVWFSMFISFHVPLPSRSTRLIAMMNTNTAKQVIITHGIEILFRSHSMCSPLAAVLVLLSVWLFRMGLIVL